jgi:hypothetical protein
MPALWATMATGPDWQAMAWAESGPLLCAMFFFFHFGLNFSRNCDKILKCVEITLKLRKI